MPSSAKRFYLCNLIPLWEIDEENVDVDWPAYHGYFHELIELQATVTHREIKYRNADTGEPVPGLKIRFEIYESDFLLSGGQNDWMGTFSSDAKYGDDAELRPLKIVKDWKEVKPGERDNFIFVLWTEAHEKKVTEIAPDGKKISKTTSVPDTLEIKTWWRIKPEPGGDVSGNPEYYYDFFLKGTLVDGKAVQLEERSDHELEGFRWSVTNDVMLGRVTPLVDGEYVFLKMLQVIDAAKHSIHIANWKMEPQATIVMNHQFRADYLQVPGMDPDVFNSLLLRHKPEPRGVHVNGGFVCSTSSNGNVIAATTDGSMIVPMVQRLEATTNVDYPSGIHVLKFHGINIAVLILDEVRSRLLIWLPMDRSRLMPAGAAGINILPMATPSVIRLFEYYESDVTLPGIMADASRVAGVVPIAGTGLPGYKDGGIKEVEPTRTIPAPRPVRHPVPTGKMKHPRGLLFAENTIFISDTGNNCIRYIQKFDASDLNKTLGSGGLVLETLAGATEAGDIDGPTLKARFRSPVGLAWDSKAKQLIVADSGNTKIRLIDLDKKKVSTLDITTIDGKKESLDEFEGVAYNPDVGKEGTIYISEISKHRILAIDVEKKTAVTAAGPGSGEKGWRDSTDPKEARFDRPGDLSYEGGKLFVADRKNHVLRVIDVGTGEVTTIGKPNDVTGTDMPVLITDILRRKAEQGVAVRILLDKAGSDLGRAGQVIREKESGGEDPPKPLHLTGEEVVEDLRHYHKNIQAYVETHPQFMFDQAWASIHDKMMIVDGKAGFTGGIDFDSQKNNGILHFRKHRTNMHWHDVTAFVEGKAVLGLEKHYHKRWENIREELDEKAPPSWKVADRTDHSIRDDQIESVRTWDRSPVFRVPGAEEVKEILKSYERAILSAREYVYMEHQYIYYPEIGKYLERAMEDNEKLNVIWLIPFFTEETSDPYQEKAQMERANAFASRITDTKALSRSGGLAGQLRRQLPWHGHFRQREMVDKLRKVDPDRFGVFSVQHVLPSGPGLPRTTMIYPHSKMILCDDKFISIGSANANGRGFASDGEHNISSLSKSAKRLRERIWGEHLGFYGLAVVAPDGSLAPLSGHHLQKGVQVRLRHHHPGFGGTVREVQSVDGTTGLVTVDGPPLDPALKLVLWFDTRLSGINLSESLAFWRKSSHSLDVYRKVKGNNGRTDSKGNLVIKGNLAKPGDLIAFGQKLVELNEDGSAKNTEKIGAVSAGGLMKVKKVKGDVIELEPGEREVPDVEWVIALPVDGIRQERPFRIKLVSRSGGKAKIRVQLMSDVSEVPYDYTISYLGRQPAAKQRVRAWEIDPPRGIEYDGPFSTLFSPWFVLPWAFVDFNPDEQANFHAGLEDMRHA